MSFVVKARRWWQILQTGEVEIEMLAAREKVGAFGSRACSGSRSFSFRHNALLAARLRAGVDAAQMTGTDAVAASWNKRVLLPG